MKNLVILGDSIVGPYKLNVYCNTYGAILARRIGLHYCEDNYTGTSTPTMLYYLRRDKQIIEDIKNADVAVISVGGNSLYMDMLTTAMNSMGMTLNDLSLAFINDAKLKVDAAFIAKMIMAFNSPQIKKVIIESVERFKIEYPIIIDAIHEINPDTVVIGQTIHNSLEEGKTLFYAGLNKLLSPYINEMNVTVRSLERTNFIYADFNRRLAEYTGKESLTHFHDGTNKFDTHLTQTGHIELYKQEYEVLTAAYPKFAAEEPANLLKDESMLDDEDRAAIEKANKSLALYIASLKELKTNLPKEYEAQTAYYDEYNKYFTITSVGSNMDNHPREVWMTPDENTDKADMVSGYPVYFEAAKGEDITVFDMHMRRIGVIKNDGSDYIAGIIDDIVNENYFNCAYLYNAPEGILILIGKYGPKAIFQK